jgi:hypothetical protein
MSDIKEELGLFETKRGFPFSKRQMIFITFVLGLGFYIGNILYSTNNLLDLLVLQDERAELSQIVVDLNQKNADLQKNYFEMKIIEGER